jgi:hypothetical protein
MRIAKLRGAPKPARKLHEFLDNKQAHCAQYFDLSED